MTSFLQAVGGTVLVALCLAWWWTYWNAWFGFRRRWPAWVIGRLGILVMFLAGMSGFAGAMLLAWTCYDLLHGVGLRLPINQISFSCGASMASFPASSLGMYYWMRHRFRRVMRIMAPRCVRCGYALRGLPVSYGRIRCPECAHINSARAVVKRFRHEKRLFKASRDEPWDVF